MLGRQISALVLLSAALKTSVVSASPTACAELLQAQAQWNVALTDPRHHTENYLYLVHAFDSDYLDSSALEYFRLRTNLIAGKDYQNPVEALVASRVEHGTGSLSTSLVTPAHAMWGASSGVILGVSPENVYATYPGDMGYVQRVMQGREGLLPYFREHGILSPDVLLGRTPRGAYNEVVIGFGGELGPRIRVLGFFNREPVNRFPEYVSSMESYARELGVPVIFDESNP